MILTYDPSDFGTARRHLSSESVSAAFDRIRHSWKSASVASLKENNSSANIGKKGNQQIVAKPLLRKSRTNKVDELYEDFETPTGGTIQELVDDFQSRHVSRELSHTLPPFFTPRGCDYTFDHEDGVEYPATGTYSDQIFCADWCGDGQDMTLSITTTCAGDEDCSSTADCRVVGCTDDAGLNPGDSPCSTTLTSFEQICDDKCVDGPAPGTPAPTNPPPAPVTPAPTSAPITPVPAPTAPAPTPTVPATTAPAPTPTVPAPTPGTTRQVVNIVRTVFANNEQGLPLDETSRGVVTTGTGFNDIVVSQSEFTNNNYGNAENGVSISW